MLQFGILTDVNLGMEFFREYFDRLEWTVTNFNVDSFEGESENTDVQYLIKHIPPEMHDIKLRKFLLGQFKKYGIKTKDFRCDFFMVKAGDDMPPHVDVDSEIAFLMPLNENTGTLGIKDRSGEVRIIYNNMFILNTKKVHWVEPVKEDRLVFRVAIRDFSYMDLNVWKNVN